MLCSCQCFASTYWDKGCEEKAGDYYRQLSSVQQHSSAADQPLFPCSFIHVTSHLTYFHILCVLLNRRNYLFTCFIMTHTHVCRGKGEIKRDIDMNQALTHSPRGVKVLSHYIIGNKIETPK